MAPMLQPGMSMAEVQGPLLVGYMVSYILYGVLIIQLYLYSVNFAKDVRWMKIMVWTLFAVETIGSVLVFFNAWEDLAAGWGDVSTLRLTRWELTGLLPVNGIVALIVQFFFCHRIWVLGKLSNSKLMMVMAIFIALVSLTSCGFTFYCGIGFQIYANNYPALARTGQLIIGWLGGNLATDILVALVMSIHLHRSKNGFWATDTLLNKIILITVQTGCITAVLSILELVLYMRNPLSNDHFAACLVNAKMYSNVLLATLNARVLTRSSTTTVNRHAGSLTTAPSSVRASLTIVNSPLWDDLNEPEAHSSSDDAAKTTTLRNSTFGTNFKSTPSSSVTGHGDDIEKDNLSISSELD